MKAKYPLIALATTALVSHAATISYTETWTPDTGSQATAGGSAFNNYPEWEYFELVSQGANARVDNAGELTLAGTGTIIAALVTPGDVGASGTSFDVSTNPLVISTSAGSRFGSPGNFNVGVTVGDATIIFHPGLGGGFHRVHNRSQTVTYQGNTNMGFTPGTDDFTPVTVSVVESGTDYEFTYSIGSYNNVINLAIADVGPINDIGLSEGGGGDGNFGSFTVTQVPEPSALGLLGLAALSLIGRRRK